MRRLQGRALGWSEDAKGGAREGWGRTCDDDAEAEDDPLHRPPDVARHARVHPVGLDERPAVHERVDGVHHGRAHRVGAPERGEEALDELPREVALAVAELDHLEVALLDNLQRRGGPDAGSRLAARWVCPERWRLPAARSKGLLEQGARLVELRVRQLLAEVLVAIHLAEERGCARMTGRGSIRRKSVFREFRWAGPRQAAVFSHRSCWRSLRCPRRR